MRAGFLVSRHAACLSYSLVPEFSAIHATAAWCRHDSP